MQNMLLNAKESSILVQFQDSPFPPTPPGLKLLMEDLQSLGLKLTESLCVCGD